MISSCEAAFRVPRFVAKFSLRVVVLVLSTTACDHDATLPLESSPSAVAAMADGVAAARHAAEAFSVELSGPRSVSVGERAAFVVTLRAGSGYKVNEEYPHKLKLIESPGLSFARMVIDRAQATVAKDTATFPVSVVAQELGPRKVAGQLAFSVCTAEKCLIERRDLQVETLAK